MVRNECKPQNPQRKGVVWFDCQHTMQLLYRLVVTSGKEEIPTQAGTRNRKRIKFPGVAPHCHGFVGTSLTVQPPSQSRIRKRVVWPEIECPMVLTFSLRPVPLCLGNQCHQHVGLREFWVEFQGLLRC